MARKFLICITKVKIASSSRDIHGGKKEMLLWEKDTSLTGPRLVIVQKLPKNGDFVHVPLPHTLAIMPNDIESNFYDEFLI